MNPLKEIAVIIRLEKELLERLYRESGDPLIGELLRENERLLSLIRYDVRAPILTSYTLHLLYHVLGPSFVLKLLEKKKQGILEELEAHPLKEELSSLLEKHRKSIDKIKDEREEYVGSTVLGMHDALVEMSGALTGLTFALGNSLLIALSALAVGVSAALSMAASEFLSRRAEGSGDPVKGAMYTGVAYISVVILLVAPFFLFNTPHISLLVSLLTAVTLIALFSFYISVVKEREFVKEFLTMVSASLGVAFISYLFTTSLKKILGV